MIRPQPKNYTSEAAYKEAVAKYHADRSLGSFVFVEHKARPHPRKGGIFAGRFAGMRWVRQIMNRFTRCL